MLKVYTYFELDKITPTLQEQYLAQLPALLQKQISLCRNERNRIQSIAAWKLLLNSLQEYHSGTLFPEPIIERDAHGKPFFANYPKLHFNISHCSLGCACAISDRPVGIDIQDIRPYKPKVAQKCCSAQELSLLEKSSDPADTFTRIWAMKESYGKMTGLGIAQDLAAIDTVSLEEQISVTFINGCYVAVACSNFPSQSNG